LGVAADPGEADIFAAPPAEPPLTAALPGFGDVAAPEPARAAATGGLEFPVGEAAEAAGPVAAPVTPATADWASVMPVEPVVSGDPPPAAAWLAGVFPPLFSRPAAASSRSLLRRLPQALAPAAITTSTTAAATRWRRLRLADVFMDVMTTPP